MPIHVAITRRVQPEKEDEFRAALLEFFQESFAHEGVFGATMLVPPPGSESREFGILRTFATESERDSFYASPVFKAWEARCAPLTDGGWSYRELHGLEAWFRSPGGPPKRWKMAVATFLGVYPVVMIMSKLLGPFVHDWPFLLGNALFTACVVALLTWIVMPIITRALNPWLHTQGPKI
jgi:antibiotic biosynthesis monooxygenase (ABM) superfamily enzyme